MPGSPSIADLLFLYGPLGLLGFVAGGLRALARRPGLPERRRRALQALWVVLLLVGGPVWVVFATAVTG